MLLCSRSCAVRIRSAPAHQVRPTWTDEDLTVAAECFLIATRDKRMLAHLGLPYPGGM